MWNQRRATMQDGVLCLLGVPKLGMEMLEPILRQDMYIAVLWPPHFEGSSFVFSLGG